MWASQGAAKCINLGAVASLQLVCHWQGVETKRVTARLQREGDLLCNVPLLAEGKRTACAQPEGAPACWAATFTVTFQDAADEVKMSAVEKVEAPEGGTHLVNALVQDTTQQEGTQLRLALH